MDLLLKSDSVKNIRKNDKVRSVDAIFKKYNLPSEFQRIVESDIERLHGMTGSNAFKQILTTETDPVPYTIRFYGEPDIIRIAFHQYNNNASILEFIGTMVWNSSRWEIDYFEKDENRIILERRLEKSIFFIEKMLSYTDHDFCVPLYFMKSSMEQVTLLSTLNPDLIDGWNLKKYRNSFESLVKIREQFMMDIKTVDV